MEASSQQFYLATQSAKSLLRHRAFSASTLLAVGASSAVAIMMAGIALAVLRPSVGSADGTVEVFSTGLHPLVDQRERVISGSVYGSLKSETGLFAALAAYRFDNSGIDVKLPIQMRGDVLVTSASFWRVVPAGLEAGALCTERDVLEPEASEMLLSSQVWRQHFSSDTHVLGSYLTTSRGTFRVVGVLAPNFRFPPRRPADFVMCAEPLAADTSFASTLGRLRAGLTEDAARARIAAIGNRFAERDRDAATAMLGASRTTNLPRTVMQRYHGEALDGTTLYLIGGMIGTAALSVLTAVLIVAVLLVARTEERGQEISIRRLIGGSRRAILGMLLSEALFLVTVGLVIGVAFAIIGSRVIAAQLRGQLSWLVLQSGAKLIGTVAVVFLIVASVVVSALTMAAIRRAEKGMASSRLGAGRASMRAASLQRRLMLPMVAVASSVVTVGLLFGLQLRRTTEQKFRTEGLAVAVSTTGGSDESWSSLLRELDHANVSVAVGVLPGLVTPNDVGVQDPNLPRDGNLLRAARYDVSGSYFRIFGLGVVRGRAFTAAEERDRVRVAVVSSSLASRLWPNQSAVGQSVRLFEDSVAVPYVVVGVVHDVGSREVSGRRADFGEVYAPWTLRASAARSLVVDGIGSEGVLRRVTSMVERGFGSDRVRFNVSTVADTLAERYALQRFLFAVFGILGLAAILLLGFGVYSVVNYFVVQRTRELGIRIALGATPAATQRLVMRHAASLVLPGTLLGAAVSWLAGTAVRRVALLDMQSLAVETFVGTAASIALVTVLAALSPVRRAGRLDAAELLRHE